MTVKVGAIDGVQNMEISPVLRRLKQAGALVDGDRLADPSVTLPVTRDRRSRPGSP